MKLSELRKKMGLEVLAGKNLMDREVKSGYCGDMLSDVLANSKECDVWLTVQVHPNVIAVSAMKGHSAILVVCGKEVEEETLKRAEEEKVVVLRTGTDAFTAAAQLARWLKS